MSNWRNTKPDVNGGAGGERYSRRAVVKQEAKKLRRKISKRLAKEHPNE